MKRKDRQNIVFSKYRKDDGPIEIFHDLAGGLPLETIERRYKMIGTAGSIDFAYSSGRPSIVRTPEVIGKVKTQADASGRVIFPENWLENCAPRKQASTES